MELRDTTASFPVEGLPEGCDLINVVFRKPLVGDYVFSYTSWVLSTSICSPSSRLVAILAPARKKWRNATFEDAKRALMGEKVERRVRDEPTGEYVDGILLGARNRTPYRWYVAAPSDAYDSWYVECQVSA